MIETTKMFRTNDGIVHDSLEEAQSHALREMMPGEFKSSATGSQIAEHILKNKDAFIEILGKKLRKVKSKKSSKPATPEKKN